MKKTMFLVLMCWFLMQPQNLQANEKTEWKIADGGNGHFYQIVDDSTIVWLQAKAAAESRGGYLATITSSWENAWIANTFTPNNIYHFLGGFQPSNSSEPSGNWTWVTGEPWVYSNWGFDEPNDSLEVGQHEDVLEYKRAVNGDGQVWNDMNITWSRSGYIVEWNQSAVVTPEPASCLLFGLGGIALAIVRRKKRGGK